MQRTGSIMPAFVFILLLGLSAYAAEKTLGSYKSLFERETSKIEAADRTSRKTALSTYGKNLAEAKEALQNRGDLDGTIAANDEIKRFEKERTGPPPALEGYPPLLVRIQKEYQSALLAVERGTSKSTLHLIERYLVPLGGLKKGLVQRGQIAEAQKVAAEIKRVTFISGAIAAAQPAEDPSPIKPPEAPSTRLSASLRKDLVLHYSFDRDGGDMVSDRSEKGNHGTVHNSKWTSTGRVGGGYEFAGPAQYIGVEDHRSMDLPAEMSIAAWVKVTRAGHGDVVCAKGYGGGGESWVLDICNGSFRYVRRQQDGASYVHATSTQKIQIGVWYHVVGIADGKRLRIAVNATETIGQVYSGPFDTNDHKVSIGSRQRSQGAYDMYLLGTIDEVMIFNRPLSAREIKKMHDSRDSL